jgi:hypothetical protein
MKRFVMGLIAAVKHAGKQLQTPRRERRAQLNVECMEERLALSASPVAIPGPVLPDAVHGYKWRRPRPWVVTPGGTTEVQPGNLAAAAGYQPEMVAANLVFGGADGLTGLTAAGHIVVTPPGGPLPT